MRKILYPTIIVLMFFISAALVLWPSPSSAKVNCETVDAQYWMDEAQKIVNLDQYRPLSTRPRLQALEKGIIINGKITSAYASLFQASKSPMYLWLSAAAFASFQVGQTMRHGYLEMAKASKVPRVFAPKVYEKNPLDDVILGNEPHTAENMGLILSAGNKAVFNDLYWQHLSTHECGTLHTINALGQLQDEAIDPKNKIHYGLLKQGWELIDQGLIREGNLLLLKVEQELILQPLIYSGVLAQVFGRVFAVLAVDPVKDSPYFSFPKFVDYCSQNHITPNFSKFTSRWKWIVSLMNDFENYNNGLYQERVSLKHLFFVSDNLHLNKEVI